MRDNNQPYNKRRKYLPKSVKFFCNYNERKGYFNFIQDKRYVRDYGDKKSKFVSVIIREPENNERSDYFAWWDTESQEYQCISSSKKYLDNCLRNPTEMEKRGEGERINVMIEEIDVYCNYCTSVIAYCQCNKEV